jgi:hypothetical protein
MNANLPEIGNDASAADEARYRGEHLLLKARAISQAIEQRVRGLLSRGFETTDDQAGSPADAMSAPR